MKAYGLVYSIGDRKKYPERYLLTRNDGSFLAFDSPDTAAEYMAQVASKNSEINGPLASILFISLVDFGLIEYPAIPKNLAKYLATYDPATGKSEIVVKGVAGVKMHGLEVKDTISRLKYVPQKTEEKTDSKPVEPEAPKAASDTQDPYEKRD